MKISVVIPVFNEEKYIGQCLKAFVKQIIKPDEIIIINNNSTDKSLEIINEFKNKLPIKIINEKRQGVIFTRNRGFDEAVGEIIIRTDADTRQPKNWLATIKKIFLEKKEIDALTGPIIFYDLPFQNTLYSKILIYFFKLITGIYPLFGPGFALKKSAWLKIRNQVCLNEKKVHEDMDLSFHLNNKNKKIYYCSDFISYASGRRIKKNPLSFFVEYPIRTIKMILNHKN